MDVNDLVAELRSLVEGARSMPMSASAVINRAQALDLVTRLEAALPPAPERVDGAVPNGTRRAPETGQPPAAAGQERDRLVTESEVYRVARIEADKERLAASREAAELRQQADDYVDTRLATFEITLTRTLEAVSRGRARLHGRSHFDALRPDGVDSDSESDASAEVGPASEDGWPNRPHQGG